MNSSLVTVATFGNPLSANLARNLLQDEGITAFVADENTTGTVWYLSNALGWVKLQVAEVDAPRARELLKATPAEHRSELDEALPVTDDEDAIPVPNVRELNAQRALRGAVFGLIMPPLLVYVIWLLIEIGMSGEPLSRRGHRSAVAAAAITLPMFTFWTWLFTGGPYSH